MSITAEKFKWEDKNGRGMAGLKKGPSKSSLWRLSGQYSNNFNIQYVYYISLPYFLLSFYLASFYFASVFFIFLPINLYVCVVAHVFFILFILFYMHSVLLFYLLPILFFGSEWEFLFSF